MYSDQGHSPTISAYTSADPTFIKENYTAQDIEVWKRNGTKVSDDIAPTITGGAGNSGGNHSDMAVLKVVNATAKGYEEATEGDSINLSQPGSKNRRGRVGKGKANTLDTSCSQGVVQPVQIGQSSQTFAHKSGTIVGKDGQDAFTIRSSNPNGVKVEQPTTCRGGLQKNAAQFEEKSPALTSAMGMGGGHTPIVDQPSYRIRRLTPIECERLQGFPDNHTALGVYDGETKPVSNTQRYKMCGNAVTVDVVHAVAERIKEIL